MPKFCYFNGKIIPEDKAKIDLRDIGLLRGYGIFESLRTYNGKPFLLLAHYNRFKKSAQSLNIKLPVSFKILQKIISQLLQKNKFSGASIKIVLTGGIARGLKYNPSSPTFFVLTEKLPGLPKSIYGSGVKLITQSFQRDLPKIKSTNYLFTVSQNNRLKKENAFELLFINGDKILESSTGNFFMFLGDDLITPKENILPGVTRDFILKIASKKFKVKEREIEQKELENADECFITGSHKEIIPVIQIDNKKIGNAKVGPKTKELMRLYKSFTLRLS